MAPSRCAFPPSDRLVQATVSGDSYRRLSVATRTGDCQWRLPQATVSGDSYRRLSVATRTGDCQWRLPEATVSGDSYRRLSVATRTGDCQWRLPEATVSGDFRRRLSVATRTGDCQWRLVQATVSGDSYRRLVQATVSGDSYRRLVQATRTGDSYRRLPQATRTGDFRNSCEQGDCVWSLVYSLASSKTCEQLPDNELQATFKTDFASKQRPPKRLPGNFQSDSSARNPTKATCGRLSKRLVGTKSHQSDLWTTFKATRRHEIPPKRLCGGDFQATRRHEIPPKRLVGATLIGRLVGTKSHQATCGGDFDWATSPAPTPTGGDLRATPKRRLLLVLLLLLPTGIPATSTQLSGSGGVGGVVGN
uniref:Uncharacterized protein LOC116957148 n=1 Tax=Petromyzon marinus TaxID=7757 RepID=A0AAJ7UFV2_PETMA|nr:uncharacterized protein LOC116957148 [Petromyzon marinus]